VGGADEREQALRRERGLDALHLEARAPQQLAELLLGEERVLPGLSLRL
jgi:hypothetical protein